MTKYESQRYDPDGEPMGAPRFFTEETAPMNVKRALSKPAFASVEYHYRDGCSIEWKIVE